MGLASNSLVAVTVTFLAALGAGKPAILCSPAKHLSIVARNGRILLCYSVVFSLGTKQPLIGGAIKSRLEGSPLVSGLPLTL